MINNHRQLRAQLEGSFRTKPAITGANLKRWQAIPSTSTSVTYKQTLAAQKMVIGLDIYFQGKLSKGQIKQVQLEVTREIW